MLALNSNTEAYDQLRSQHNRRICPRRRSILDVSQWHRNPWHRKLYVQAHPPHCHSLYITLHGTTNQDNQPVRPAIPIQPQVHIIGRGEVPENHYQFPPGFKVDGVDHYQFHLPPHIPPEERKAGRSRFYQWHFDGALYDIPPPRVRFLFDF